MSNLVSQRQDTIKVSFKNREREKKKSFLLPLKRHQSVFLLQHGLDEKKTEREDVKLPSLF